MPRSPQPPAEQHALRNAIALTGVMLAAAGSVAEGVLEDHDPVRPASPAALTALGHQGLASFNGPEAAPAGQTAESTTTSTAPGKVEITRPADDGSENGRFSKQVETFMRRNTVYISGLDCSGEAIRGAKGQIIGVLTAEHCSLTDAKNQRIQGSDGKYYIVQPEPVRAETGASMDNLSTVATIDSFIVPNTTDFTRDLAIGVAKGQDPSEVLQVYERSTLPNAKLKQLTVGDKLYMAGWPQYQPRNKTGVEERQSFEMSILGLGKSETDEGKDLNVVWAAVPPTKDGSECSYGASGSEGFVMADGQAKAIGTLSVFMDLTGKVPDIPTPNSMATPLGIGNGKNIAAICGFSYEAPTPANGGMVLHAVRSSSEIPGYVSPEQAIATARQQFEDPSYTKTIINGAVEVPGFNSGANKGGPPSWVNNPALFHDAAHNSTVFAWASSTDPDHLNFVYVEDKDLYEIFIYPHDNAIAPNLLSSTGADQYQADPTGQTSGDFIDGNQLVFGNVLPGAPNFNGSGFTLETKDGSIGIVPSKGVK